MSSSPHRYLLERPPEANEATVRRAIAIAEGLRQRGMPTLLTLRHVSIRSKVDYLSLRRVIERRDDGYEQFQVQRPSGAPRWIAAPGYPLATCQRWVLRNILYRVPVHPDAMAYVPGRSAVRAAERHLGAAWLIKIDLKDFFHQIDERMVQRQFAALGFSDLLSFELARISTRQPSDSALRWLPSKYKQRIRYQDDARPYGRTAKFFGYLPQGAPSSGALANLMASNLDQRLSAWAEERGLVYTRYSDDIVFSGGREAYTPNLAKRQFAGASAIIRQAGWEPNRRKGRIVAPGSRLIVLGLLVDGDKLRVRREVRAQITTHLRGIETFGPAGHAAHRSFRDPYGMLNHVRGLIDYVHSVDADLAAAYSYRLEPFEARSGNGSHA